MPGRATDGAALMLLLEAGDDQAEGLGEPVSQGAQRSD
jgi:hypothetical protein